MAQQLLCYAAPSAQASLPTPSPSPHPNLPQPTHPPLRQGDVANARKEFERASRLKSNGRPSIAGVLALAGLEFGQRNYKEALAL